MMSSVTFLANIKLVLSLSCILTVSGYEIIYQDRLSTDSAIKSSVSDDTDRDVMIVSDDYTHCSADDGSCVKLVVNSTYSNITWIETIVGEIDTTGYTDMSLQLVLYAETFADDVKLSIYAWP